MKRAVEAAWRAEHPPRTVDALAQQHSSLAAAADRLDQGSASEKVAAWKQVQRNHHSTKRLVLFSVIGGCHVMLLWSLSSTVCGTESP